VDAYEAVEHGNDDPNQPRYDLCFGGRRAFCKTRYSDLGKGAIQGILCVVVIVRLFYVSATIEKIM
jgi:hypothetical protein